MSGPPRSRHPAPDAEGAERLAELRRRSWPAPVLLLAPWLAGAAAQLPGGGPARLRALALVPGLLAAVYLTRTLYRNLPANRPDRDGAPVYKNLGAANWITLWRAAGVVALAAFLPGALRPAALSTAAGWAPALIYLAVSLGDILDGTVARRFKHETGLGRILDIETDAAGLLVGSLTAAAFGRLPWFYLAAGSAYYLFRLGIAIRRRRGLPLVVLEPRPYARITAGFQMGLVGVALLPLFDERFCSLAALLFIVPLLFGFGRDWLVVSCRLTTGAGQEAGVDRSITRLTRGWLAPAARLLVLGALAAVLIDGRSFAVDPAWLAAVACCGLLAGAGLAGRTSALVLILLLGGSWSPLGSGPAAVVLFCCATVVLLAGTGAWSLWSPEERFLYRRWRGADERQPGPG